MWIGMMVAGCSSSGGGGGTTAATACPPDIAGNYQVTSVRVDGTCDKSIDGDGKDTFTISRQPDGSYGLVIQNLGGTCPATYDKSACRLQAQCTVSDKTTGAVGITQSVDYTFSGSSFHGSSADGANPPFVTDSCNVTYHDEGARL